MKVWSEKEKQASELDSDMTDMSKISYREF